jgi:hypothetical protein
MAKAGAPKKAKPKPKLTDKEQSERFRQTARELGVDESGKKFEIAFDTITSNRQQAPQSHLKKQPNPKSTRD